MSRPFVCSDYDGFYGAPAEGAVCYWCPQAERVELWDDCFTWVCNKNKDCRYCLIGLQYKVRHETMWDIEHADDPPHILTDDELPF